MKSLLHTAFLLTGLLLAGCSKSDPQPASNSNNNNNNNNTNPGTDSYIKATVAGSPAFAAVGTITQVVGLHYTSTDPTDAPARLLLRGNVGGSGIILNIAKFVGVGTYLLKADPDATLGTSIASYSENDLNGPFYYTQYLTPAGTVEGQIVVSSWDAAAKRVKGTFSFTGVTVAINGTTPGLTKQLTGGTFDVQSISFY